MLSLKQLFWLMGSVSTLMIAALLYTKRAHPGHVSVAEVRAIDRLCQRYADDIMSKLSQEQGVEDQEQFFKGIHECLASCRTYLVTSRAKGVTLQGVQLEVPACLQMSSPQEATPTSTPEPKAPTSPAPSPILKE